MTDATFISRLVHMNKKNIFLSATLFFTAILTVSCSHHGTKSTENTNTAEQSTVANVSAEDYQTLVTKPIAWKSGKIAKPTALWAADSKKVHVIRLMATWCPHCKNDLKHLNDNFQNGTYKKDQVQVHLISYNNRKEKQDTAQKFARTASKTFAPFAQDNFSLSFWDKAYTDIEPLHNEHGTTLFPQWTGVPFGIIVDCQDNVIFRGHFTDSPEQEQEQYAMIAKAQVTCAK